jgi:hypothetical protein
MQRPACRASAARSPRVRRQLARPPSHWRAWDAHQAPAATADRPVPAGRSRLRRRSVLCRRATAGRSVCSAPRAAPGRSSCQARKPQRRGRQARHSAARRLQPAGVLGVNGAARAPHGAVGLEAAAKAQLPHAVAPPHATRVLHIGQDVPAAGQRRLAFWGGPHCGAAQSLQESHFASAVARHVTCQQLLEFSKASSARTARAARARGGGARARCWRPTCCRSGTACPWTAAPAGRSGAASPPARRSRPARPCAAGSAQTRG